MSPRPSRKADGLAWITGGSSGIGRALALQLAREGWTVVISSRTREDLEAVAAWAGVVEEVFCLVVGEVFQLDLVVEGLARHVDSTVLLRVSIPRGPDDVVELLKTAALRSLM